MTALHASVADAINRFYAWVGAWLAKIWGLLVDVAHAILVNTIGFITPEPPSRDMAGMFLGGVIFVVIGVLVMAKKLFQK